MVKFLAGLSVILVAIAIQSFLASVGIYLNLALAALIALALIFDFWELLFADLLAVFVMNWQPAPSLTLIVFFLIPVAVFFSKHVFRWQLWIHALIAVFFGFVLFYIVASPETVLSNLKHGLLDIFAGALLAEFVIFSLR